MAEQLVAGFGPITPGTVEMGFDWPMSVWTNPWDFVSMRRQQEATNPTLGEMATFIFGATHWPCHIPTPYAWIELVVNTADEVPVVLTHLRQQGHEILRVPDVEASGLLTAMAISPQGLLTRVTFSPTLAASAPALDPASTTATVRWPSTFLWADTQPSVA